jgi:hypothetical protein
MLMSHTMTTIGTTEAVTKAEYAATNAAPGS